MHERNPQKEILEQNVFDAKTLGGQRKKMAAMEEDPAQPLWKGAASPMFFCISAGSRVDLGSVRDGRTQLLCAALGGQTWGHRNTGPGQGGLSPGD